MRQKNFLTYFALTLLLILSVMLTASVASADDGDDDDILELSEELRDAVTVRGVRRHQKKFQKFADANDGTRASGTDGYDASADYVAKKMRRADYDVEVLEFEFDFFQVTGSPRFEQSTPVPTTYVDQFNFDVMEFSGSGSTGIVDFIPIDINLANPKLSTSGCEQSDFPASVLGKIALVQRSGCFFSNMAIYAETAGAVGVVIFNNGIPGSTDLFFGTLGGPGFNIPVVGTTFAIGVALAGGATGSLDVSTISEARTTSNVIAESRSGDPNNVVMAGAHLDSVAAGPGINDNGSGSAAILEIAIQLAEEYEVNDDDDDDGITNKVRFAWWGAEELGLLGSIDYAFSLSQAELDQIAVYLNFDMIGSPNFVRFVYDGDGLDTPPTILVPPESAQVEQVFLDYFERKGLETEPTALGGQSDHFAFCVLGVPCGGLFTGAGGIKTAEQAAVYGGTAGDRYDPCYHLACDTINNLSRKALNQNSDAAAHAILFFASGGEDGDDKAIGFTQSAFAEDFVGYLALGEIAIKIGEAEPQ